MNLGIDFGSTYTTVSRYRTDHEVLEAYDTGDGVAIPSVVAVNSNNNKTSTGFVKGGVGAKAEDVELMYNTVHSYGLQVKASGGIRDKESALAMIEAGATRLGTSSGVKIVG